MFLKARISFLLDNTLFLCIKCLQIKHEEHGMYFSLLPEIFSWFISSLPLEIYPSPVLPELLIHADQVTHHSLSCARINAWLRGQWYRNPYSPSWPHSGFQEIARWMNSCLIQVYDYLLEGQFVLFVNQQKIKKDDKVLRSEWTDEERIYVERGEFVCHQVSER